MYNPEEPDLDLPQFEDAELQYLLEEKNGRPTVWRTWRITNAEADFQHPDTAIYCLLSDPATVCENGDAYDLPPEEREVRLEWFDSGDCWIYEGLHCEIFDRFGRPIKYCLPDVEDAA